MTDLDTARECFLARVEENAYGQGGRFAPPLDELIAWSEGQGLVFDPGPQDQVRYKVPGARAPVRAAAPRAGDGAKLTVLGGAGFPAGLRTAARSVLARVGGKPVAAARPPEVAFAQLIWPPHRAAVLEVLSQSVIALADTHGQPAASKR